MWGMKCLVDHSKQLINLAWLANRICFHLQKMNEISPLLFKSKKLMCLILIQPHEHTLVLKPYH